MSQNLVDIRKTSVSAEHSRKKNGGWYFLLVLVGVPIALQLLLGPNNTPEVSAASAQTIPTIVATAVVRELAKVQPTPIAVNTLQPHIEPTLTNIVDLSSQNPPSPNAQPTVVGVVVEGFQDVPIYDVNSPPPLPQGGSTYAGGKPAPFPTPIDIHRGGDGAVANKPAENKAPNFGQPSSGEGIGPTGTSGENGSLWAILTAISLSIGGVGAFSWSVRKKIYKRDVSRGLIQEGQKRVDAAHWNHDRTSTNYNKPNNGRMLTRRAHYDDHVDRAGRNGLSLAQNLKSLNVLWHSMTDDERKQNGGKRH